ncbi:MAG TPA: serine/threonine-protein kinase [Gemmataceae bacterium]|jgi:serine/threonine protein kinase/WD40 repeat protein|nr:serine/threonine-protein kinase [Gemmataceae bacterium]
MNDDILYAPATLDVLDRFLTEYRRATRPAEVIEHFSARHPELAEEFRIQAGFAFIDPMDEPADLPDIALLREIGRGGMGVVYEGWQESLARPVAVKLHRMTDVAADRGQFLHECRTLARLHQTSIVPVHTAGRSGPWLYYVMPLIEGATLADLIRRARSQANDGAPLPDLTNLATGPTSGHCDLPADAIMAASPAYVRSAIDVLIDAADAIEYAHREGVWHLDLKPANLMLDSAGHSWVIDFGIAHQSTSTDADVPIVAAADTVPSPSATQAAVRGAPFLTLAYAAPERWRGAADARSDVWGLGATLYELLTLRRPFPTDDATTLAEAVAHRDPTPASRLTADLPRDLAAVCAKALSKNPADRYQTAAAFAGDLRRWQEGVETSARTWSPVARLFRWAHRHKPWTVAALSAVLGILVAFILLWRQEQLRADEARAKGQVALTEEKLLREADSHAKSKMWSLLELARQRAQVPRAGRRAEVRRILLEAGRERQRSAPDHTTPILDVAFRSLYAETLGMLDETEVAPVDRADMPYFEFRDWPATIHPDGKLIAIGTARRPLVWRRGGVKPKVDAAEETLPRGGVEYGPAGDYLAELLSEETGGGLRIWDREATRMLGELVSPGKPGSIVLAVGFDERETRLWAVRNDRRISGWKLPELTPVTDWPMSEKPSGTITAAAFGPGGRTVALGNSAGQVIGYDAAGSVIARRAALPAKAVEALAWHPQGGRLAVGTEDGTLHTFDTDGAMLFRTNVSADGVSRIVFTPDGKWIIGHFRNASARYWDAWTGRMALIAGAHPWSFSRDGRTYVSASPQRVEFGALVYPEALTRWEGHRAPVLHLRWAENSRRLVSLASDFGIRVWDVDHPDTAVGAMAGPTTGGFWATQAFVAISPDGKRVGYASGGLEKSKAVVYDVATSQAIASWDLPGGFETMAAAGPDRFVLVREQTHADTVNVTTVVYDLEPGKPLPAGREIRMSEPTDERRFIEHWLQPNGKYYLWSGPRKPARERRLELYDVAAGKLVWKIVTPPTDNGYAPFGLLTEDLKTLWISGCSEQPMEYDLTTPNPPKAVKHAPLAVSADRHWQAYAVSLDAGNLIPRVSIRAQPGDQHRVDLPCPDYQLPAGGQYLFSPDGRYLVWAGLDGTIFRVDLPLLAERVKQFDEDMAGGVDR